MSSKATSWNRWQLKVTKMEHDHLRALRSASVKNGRKTAPLDPIGEPDRAFQEHLFGILLSPAYRYLNEFGIAAHSSTETSELSYILALYRRCLKGHWNVTLQRDIDGCGNPGWKFQRTHPVTTP